MKKPTDQELEQAIYTIIRWIGEDPAREGLIDTPKRVRKKFLEVFSGYQQDPAEVLATNFDEIDNYNDIIFLHNIELDSYCEHHLMPIHGTVDIAYIPNGRVIGIGKIARVVNIFGYRLQMQERLTAQIANAIQEHASPLGVGVFIKASHKCMTARGVRKIDSYMTTSHLTGCFKTNNQLQKKLLTLYHSNKTNKAY